MRPTPLSPATALLAMTALGLTSMSCRAKNSPASPADFGGAAAAAEAPAAAPMIAQAVPGMAPPPFIAPPADAEPMAAEAEDAPSVLADDEDFARDAVARAEQPPPWAPVRVFPVPDYSAPYDGPRMDFRETVYWQPTVRTGDDGRAEVSFYLSDSVTSFRATAQGAGAGRLGVDSTLLKSKLPVSLAARLPLEVSRGDRIELPVTLSNTTRGMATGQLQVNHGPAFATSGSGTTQTVSIPARRRRTRYVSLDVIGNGDDPAAGTVDVSVAARGIQDAMRRTIRVVPPGFPQEQSVGGTLDTSESFVIDLPEPVDGSVDVNLALYPSPSTQMIAGTEALIAEPGGCFEQASSTNYPNVMVLSYLRDNGASNPQIEDMAQARLDRGYKLLTSYETSSKGYEWFGSNPGHEALSAYGLMQFADMQEVYDDVSPKMVKRTKEWLMGRRNGKGGFQRSSQALDSFGRASPETTDAYITYALTEVGTTGIDAELSRMKKLAATTKDTYVLALATGALLNARPDDGATADAVTRLAKRQAKDGRFTGGRETITMSGGQALDIETTAFATLALLDAPSGAHNEEIRAATEWLQTQNQGGNFASTQSTVLALKVLGAAAGRSGQLPSATLSVRVNDGTPRTISITPDDATTLRLSGFADEFRPGKNKVELTSTEDLGGLPFSFELAYRTPKPPSSPKADVQLSTTPSTTTVRNGGRVTIKAKVRNKRGTGLPMVVARVGIPGGLRYDTKQLDELVEDGKIDYYETREREVIAYFRAMRPREQRSFDLHLLASVPGTYAAPASSTYLYYTDEHRHYTDGFVIDIETSS